MNLKQKIGFYTIAPLFAIAIGCTYFNRPQKNKNIEAPDSISTQKKLDIYDQYEQAKADSIKGTISADSFQTIKKQFEEEMKYVECGD